MFSFGFLVIIGITSPTGFQPLCGRCYRTLRPDNQAFVLVLGFK